MEANPIDPALNNLSVAPGPETGNDRPAPVGSADAGTDTFDRDFALSLVSSEQEALTEIDAAIKRIHDGTYGICEATQKPIAKDRLLAVPFTRYSAEAQKDIERNRFRARSAAGLFGELGEEGAGKMSDDGGGDDE